MKKLVYFAAAAITALSACKEKEEPDVVKPVIAVNQNKLKISGNAGDTLVISAAFSDDRELGNAKIEIHDAFDGHSHKTTSQKFEFSQIVPLSGKSFVHDFKIPVPANATAGPYHVIVKCTDKEGNEAAFVEIDLTLFHPEMAALLNFKVNDQDVSEFFEYTHSDSLRLHMKGLLKSIASSGLEKAEFKIKKEEGHSHKTTHDEHEDLVFERVFNFSGEAEYAFDFHAVAKYAQDHEYALHVFIVNKDEHRTTHVFEIKFK